MANDRHTGEWYTESPDPDPKQDLGYELDSWNVADAHCNGEEHLVFVPSSERILEDNEFIVAHPKAVCELGEKL